MADVVHVCERAGHIRATPHCGQCRSTTTAYCTECGERVDDSVHRCL